MDEHKCYLLDQKGLKIMLNEKHFQLLKKEGVMGGGGRGR